MVSWFWRKLIGRSAQHVSPKEEAPPEGSEATPEEVYHDAARHFLDVQISTLDVLDNQTAQSFSVGSLVLPVTFALLNLGDGQTSLAAKAALVGALILYLVLLAFVALASSIRGLEYRPHIPTLQKHSQVYPGDTLRRWVADEYEQSIQENTRVLVKKARLVGAAGLALYCEALLLSLAAIAALLL